METQIVYFLRYFPNNPNSSANASDSLSLESEAVQNSTAQDPLPVQVQLKGVFHSARYETPGDGCCRDLKPVQENGFTQFVVPKLATAGRVYLNVR